MYERNLYWEKILPFIDRPVIKVITGMRRIGKSCILKMIIEKLDREHGAGQRTVYIDKESLEYEFIQDHRALYEYVKNEFKGFDGKKYLFVDEIQEIENWERAIDSIFAKGGVDIFITGSNAHLLSSELSTLLSGRYIEIQVYALSFQEFIDFSAERHQPIDRLFQEYLKYGGFPGIHHFDLSESVIYQYIGAIYNTILLKDVIKRNQVRNIRLLENLARYIFDNIGNIFSAKKIADYLKGQKMKVGIETVQNYLTYLTSTFAVTRVDRYDIKGKRLLELYEKYYLGDIGLRHALMGFRELDIAGILENLVFLELKRRGYQVTIGKLDNREIDFIAEKESRKIYLQVAYLLHSPETIEREFSPLREIRNNYPKYVLSMDSIFGTDFEGIQRIHLMDFLLNQDL
jgi:predicted AAA+ superfamily ATPase